MHMHMHAHTSTCTHTDNVMSSTATETSAKVHFDILEGFSRPEGPGGQCFKRRARSCSPAMAIRSSTAVACLKGCVRSSWAPCGVPPMTFAHRCPAEAAHKAKLVCMLVSRCAAPLTCFHHSDCPHGRVRPPVEPNVAFQGQLVQVSRTCCWSARGSIAAILRLTPRRGRCVEDIRDARRQPREEKIDNASLSHCRSQSF